MCGYCTQNGALVQTSVLWSTVGDLCHGHDRHLSSRLNSRVALSVKLVIRGSQISGSWASFFGTFYGQVELLWPLRGGTVRWIFSSLHDWSMMKAVIDTAVDALWYGCMLSTPQFLILPLDTLWQVYTPPKCFPIDLPWWSEARRLETLWRV